MASKRSRQAFEADLQKQESPYVFFGTPLPPLDERTRDDGSYVPVWKQEVTDDRGRKRLHGAFTGGFSAGYFNTVGSKEGWTPSAFVSSRQTRAKDGRPAVQQRPEDFMDEDDLREAEEAKGLSTSDAFAGFGSTAEDSSRSAGLMDVFKTTGETVGVKLLKRMGWKEGQGIGPRVRRKANVGDAEPESGEVHLFAPENSAMISFSKKSDHKGLGYTGEARISNRSAKTALGQRRRASSEDEDPRSKMSLLATSKKTGKQTGTSGMGVGILNDTGSDDDDAYDIGPKISYSKVIGSDRKNKTKKKNDSMQAGANPLVKAKPVFLSKKLLSAKSSLGFRRTHDGRLPLEGFVLADELDSFASISINEDSMKPPEVPLDWQSSRTPAPDRIAPAYVSTADAAKASNLDTQARAALLGEKQLPGKSVFDFLTPAARNKLISASGNTNLPLAGSQPPPAGYEAGKEDKAKLLQDLVPPLDGAVALQALARGVGGWMPYAEDQDKRDRYRFYLEIRAGLREGLPTRVPSFSQDDWVNEMQEFARAAQVFKPVTGLMASRFTSSTTQPKHSGEVEKITTGEALLTKPVSKPEDPAEAAARIGMFGPMTRTVINFYPTRLLCKRFNVKPPDHVQPDSGDSRGDKDLAASHERRSQFQDFRYESSTKAQVDPLMAIKESAHSDHAKFSPNELQSGTSDAHTLEPVRIDPAKNEALERERPGEAVFKAIFGSDDEDEDE